MLSICLHVRSESDHDDELSVKRLEKRRFCRLKSVCRRQVRVEIDHSLDVSRHTTQSSPLERRQESLLSCLRLEEVGKGKGE